jgi:hypothetical protein
MAWMVWGKVPRNGKLVKSEKIDRGPPVLHSAEDWSKKGSSTYDNILQWLLVFCVVVLIPVWLLVVFVVGLTDTFFLIYPWVYGFIYIVMFTYSSKRVQKQEVELGIHTGLFQHGLQYRFPFSKNHLFIPYRDIERFSVDTSWPYMKLVLHLRGFRRPLKLVHAPTILGLDGIQKLESTLAGSPDPVGPPRLVVYGGRGAKVEVLRDNGMDERLQLVSDVRSQL